MSKIIHNCKWISFAISTFIIVEEMPSDYSSADLFCKYSFSDIVANEIIIGNQIAYGSQKENFVPITYKARMPQGFRKSHFWPDVAHRKLSTIFTERRWVAQLLETPK